VVPVTDGAFALQARRRDVTWLQYNDLRSGWLSVQPLVMRTPRPQRHDQVTTTIASAQLFREHGLVLLLGRFDMTDACRERHLKELGDHRGLSVSILVLSSGASLQILREPSRRFITNGWYAWSPL
jgi:hypothetical protein